MTFRFDKGKAPGPLRAWLRDNQPLTERSWKELPGDVKDALRTRMHADQHGLCCYCYTRIAPDHISHIEHIEPQNDHNRFAWDNLALACDGGNHSGNPAHCDHAKGQTPLAFIHPYRQPVARSVRLRQRTGELRVAEEARHDVEQVLNLNVRHLQRLREAALKTVLKTAVRDLQCSNRRQAHWRPRDLQPILKELQARTEPLDYQPLIEAWLERRLRQAP